MSADLFRCSPNFYNREHRDCVVYQAGNKHLFGRLLFVFTCTVGTAAYPIALIEPYDAPLDGAHLSITTRKKDRDLSFYRVRTRKRAAFISLDSIIRGALLVPDWEKEGDYLVHDLIDGDMFLRIKQMKGM